MAHVVSPRAFAGRWLALAGLGLVGLACSGAVGERPGGGPGPGPGGGSPAGPGRPSPGNDPQGPAGPGGGTQTPVPPGTVHAAVAPLRRLTAEQYRNTVRDLLGLAERPEPPLPADDAVADRFFSNTVSALKSVDLDRYADAADALAKQAVGNLAALLPCDPKGGEAACARQFIQRFGRRAYRRPLSDAEVTRLEKLHAAGGDFAGGVELVIQALLQSPKFLYLHEPVPAGAAGQVVPVDRWALASRLSYYLLGTMPDEPLFQAAESGKLATAEGVAAEAARLMKDPRFAATLGSFHSQWLSLHELGGADKDPKLFPEAVWNPAIKAALAQESRRFVEYVLDQGDGKLETLLSAPFSVLSDPLYAFYGATRPAGAAPGAWQRVELPKDQRAGLVTQGSLLAAQAHADKTSYILRGKLVREALLCTPIPPPPPDAANVESKLPPTASARDRAAEHRVRPECATCHELFDPIGFAFETFDAIGRWRATEADGKAIDAHVELTRAGTLDGPVTGAVELARRLGGSNEVRDCVTRQWMRFALGRDDAGDDEAARQALAAGFRDGGGKVRDLLASLARSDAFRFQTVSGP
jgi:hypothetical protein